MNALLQLQTLLFPLSPLLQALPVLPFSESPYYDEVLQSVIGILIFAILVQSYAFSRPPPLPMKKLPAQPTINLEFSPPTSSEGLPDSFAPLLSSSHLEILTHALSADQLHALSFNGSLTLHSGPHAIPFHKAAPNKPSRPPLGITVSPKTNITIQAAIGTDNLSSADDHNPAVPVAHRSKSMVRNVNAVISPPLKMGNVAATLVHLPNLFEDHAVPNMRRVQILQWGLDFLSTATGFVEKVLWSLEQVSGCYQEAKRFFDEAPESVATYNT